MKKNLLLLLLLSSATLHSQTAPFPIFCGNEIFSNIVREKHPALHQAFDATFETARVANRISNRSPLTINVVVHIVWKEDAENLPDSVIHNQIQVLNADYNRLNADTANLRAIFHPVAGNADIHFQLADIVRVQTNQLFEVSLLGSNLLPEVKHNADGGSDAWNTEQYLNIWVCKIQPIAFGGITVGQIFGFAFPPNNLPHWPAGVGAPTPDEDGVVIDYRVFGSNNPNIAEIPGGTGNLTVKGRTPVHEVGHYLGLRHIWGDGGILGLPNDCAQSDGVDDTPFANAQSSFDCDTTKNTCAQVEIFYNADMPDLIENYMDYSSEGCMNMFTQGQADLMRNVLQGPRSGLLMSVSAKETAGEIQEFRLSPNPATERVALNFNLLEKTNVAIRLFNTTGQPLDFSTFGTYPAGVHQIELVTRYLTPGLYFVEMRTENGVRVQKLVVH